MRRVVSLRPLADSNITRYFHYIAEDSPDSAIRFVQAVHETFSAIAEWPLASPAHPLRNVLLKGLRKRPIKGFRNHDVFYLVPDDRSIRVIRILHAAMDHDSILEVDDLLD